MRDESLNKRKAGGGSTGHYILGQRVHTPEAAIQLAEATLLPLSQMPSLFRQEQADIYLSHHKGQPTAFTLHSVCAALL